VIGYPRMKKIIIVGPGAAGKDHLANMLTARGYSRAVSCTTRPMRVGEQDGEAYHFITDQEFRSRITNDEFREWYSFGAMNWLYGTMETEFQKADLFIMSPPVLPSMGEALKGFAVVYLNIPEPIRCLRMTLRADADSVERRLEADAHDFRDFKTFDVEITSPDFTVDDVLQAVTAL
jgi:guanylate kinase